MHTKYFSFSLLALAAGLIFFGTPALAGTLPTVATGIAASVTTNSAVLQGTITSLGSASLVTSHDFTLLAGGTLGPLTPASTISIATPGISFTATLSGLACGTLYGYAATATSSVGTATGVTQYFTTTGCATSGNPTVVTVSATGLTPTSETLVGKVTAFGGGTPPAADYFSVFLPGSITPVIGGVHGPYLSAPGTFSAVASGLACNTTYTYNASVQLGSFFGLSDEPFWPSIPSFTTLPCAPPSTLPAVVTVSATGVTTTSAIFTGSITSTSPNATIVGFGYNTATTTTTGSDPAITNSGSFGAGPFVLSISGLACNTSYHFRAFATNTVGRGWGGDLGFTTSACPPTIPSVITTAVGAVTATTAVINGQVTGLGGVGVTVAPGFTVSGGAMGSISPASITAVGTTFNATLSGLSCGTAYTYTATATNSAGTATAPSSVTFTTSACVYTPPTVATTIATSVTATSATLNGIVNTLGTGGTATMSFLYGMGTSLSSTATPTAPAIAATGSTAFSYALSGLACNTLYSFNASATNTGGTATGIPLTFTTSACPIGTPSVVTNAATSVGITAATMNGTMVGFAGALSASVGFNYGTTTAYGTTMISSTIFAPASFNSALSSLSCGTLYHYRAYATTTGGTAYGADMTFTTALCPVGLPSVLTVSATAITQTSASLGGNLTGLGGASSAMVGFNTGPTASYGGTLSIAVPMTAGGMFYGGYSGLACNTVYHFRAWATSSGGTAYGADATFTTSACPVGAPTVVTDPATSVTATSAVLNGHVTALGIGASSIASRTFTSTTGTVTPNAASATLPATWSFTATGLVCNTAYTYTATATNDVLQTGSGSAVTFTTSACPIVPPSVATNSATSVAVTSATLNGTLAGLGGASSATTAFNYGTTTAYGSSAPFSSMSATGAFAVPVTGLVCNTLYHFQATAANSAGTATGADATFTTSACPLTPPSVTTNAATSITATTAAMNGTLYLPSGAGTVSTGFDYGTTTAYGTSVAYGSTFTSLGYSYFSVALSGLSCGTTYHYRAYALNSSSIVVGTDTSFVPPCPVPMTVTTDDATSVIYPNATLNGTINSLGSGGNATVRGFQYGPSSTTFGSWITQTGSFGAGSFSASLSGLSCATPIYWRAYAANSLGTVYGDTLGFICAGPS